MLGFKNISILAIAALSFAATTTHTTASDWPRFHGPDGAGVSTDTVPPPEKWSADENLKWKLKLPGPGSSCPIVVGDKVFVTCWSGYAVGGAEGDEKDLRRHLVCVDKNSGKVVWDKSIEPVLPEDNYSGMFTQHGYASHTPTSDGKHVYVFFGKTGVLAFDLEGNKLWQTSVGTGSGERNWGTASSPILYKNLVIVPATAESKSLVALDKETGKQVWKVHDEGFALTWGSPALVVDSDGHTDVVMAVPYSIWAFDAQTGKRRWTCEGLNSDSICASVLSHGNMVYAMELGPRGGGRMAVKSGGEGDVTKTNIVWRASDSSRIETPIYYEGRIYFVAKRQATCLDAESGKVIYQKTLGGGAAGGGGQGQRGPGGPGGGQGVGGRRGSGGGRGGMGGMGSQDYGSPVLAADRSGRTGNIYYIGRNGQSFVYTAGPEFKLLATNRFPDDGDFSSTPAISEGALYVRSSKYLYCVAKTSAD